MTGVFQPAILVPSDPGMTLVEDFRLTDVQRRFVVALRGQYRRHCEAMSDGDVERLLEMFTDDAIWIGSGWPTRNGKQQLRALFEEVAGTATVSFESLFAFVDGTAGWNAVDYRVQPKDSAVKPWVFRTSFAWTGGHDDWLCNGVHCFTC